MLGTKAAGASARDLPALAAWVSLTNALINLDELITKGCDVIERVWRPRVLVLPIAAVIIVGLVAFKLSQPPRQSLTAILDERRPAPKFLALDSDNKLVKIERYLGRQEVLLIFFDGEAGADRDTVLLRARQQFPELKRRGVQVVGVSATIPQYNRQAMERGGKFPFPLLSDPEFLIHRLWGRYNEDRLETQTGVFWIDRAGQVAWSGKSPRPEADLDRLLPPLKESSLSKAK